MSEQEDTRMYPGEENTPYYSDSNLAFPPGSVKLPPRKHTANLPPLPPPPKPDYDGLSDLTRFRLAAALRQATNNTDPFPPSGGDR